MRPVQLELLQLMDPLSQKYAPWHEDAPPKAEKKSKYLQVTEIRWSRFRKTQGQFDKIYRD